MPLLAVCAGLQCRRLDDRAGRRAANGTRPGLHKGCPLARRPHAQTSRHRASTPYKHIMKGRWPFSRKTAHDGEASGSASRGRDREGDRERDRRRMPPPRQLGPSPARASPQLTDPRRVDCGPCATASTCRSGWLASSSRTASPSLGRT
jgi:hypothetical protein